jgi:methionine-rich copper-binding protein CopC
MKAYILKSGSLIFDTTTLFLYSKGVIFMNLKLYSFALFLALVSQQAMAVEEKQPEEQGGSTATTAKTTLSTKERMEALKKKKAAKEAEKRVETAAAKTDGDKQEGAASPTVASTPSTPKQESGGILNKLKFW